MISLTFSKKTNVKIPVVQSHRGFWNQDISENTLKAIQNAFLNGFQMTEFDVRLTLDEKVILFHDDKIDKEKVSRKTLNELQKKHQINTLDEVLVWFASVISHQQIFFLNIEIKSNSIFDRRLESQVLKLIERYQVQDQVLISSFNPLSLFYFRVMKSKVTRSLLLTMDATQVGNSLMVKSMVLNMLARPHYLHLDYRDWQNWYIQTFLKDKIRIILWTCNDLVAAQRYLKEGAMGIISDNIKPTDLK